MRPPPPRPGLARSGGTISRRKGKVPPFRKGREKKEGREGRRKEEGSRPVLNISPLLLPSCARCSLSPFLLLRGYHILFLLQARKEKKKEGKEKGERVSTTATDLPTPFSKANTGGGSGVSPAKKGEEEEEENGGPLLHYPLLSFFLPSPLRRRVEPVRKSRKGGFLPPPRRKRIERGEEEEEEDCSTFLLQPLPKRRVAFNFEKKEPSLPPTFLFPIFLLLPSPLLIHGHTIRAISSLHPSSLHRPGPAPSSILQSEGKKKKRG